MNHDCNHTFLWSHGLHFPSRMLSIKRIRWTVNLHRLFCYYFVHMMLVC